MARNSNRRNSKTVSDNRLVVEEYPTESDAQTAADRLRLNIDDPTRRAANKEITVKGFK